MARRAWGEAVQNREEQFELKRQAVLRTAAVMIRKRGFERLSLGDIADELQVSKPTVYYYFRNKEEILREILQLAVDQFLDATDHPEDFPDLPQLSGAARLERFLRRCVRILGEEIGSCLLSTPREVLDEDTRRQFEEKGHPIDELVEGIIRDGARDGSLKPCDVPATYLMIVGSLRFIPTLHFDQQYSTALLADSLVNLLMIGLRTPTGNKS